MSTLIGIYHSVLYEPLLNGLVFLTAVLPFHDLGLAVILLTILVRTALFPFTHHSVKAQVKMRELEPHIQKIRTDLKDNQEEQAKRIMALYKEHGVSPFSGCLMLLVQIPILIALYQVFQVGIGDGIRESLYAFVSLPPTLNTLFLGSIDLTGRSYVLAALAGATQFLQMQLSLPPSGAAAGTGEKNDMMRAMNTQMRYVMPGIIVIISLQFPAAVALYWTTMNIFAIIHEMIVRRKANALGQSGHTHDQRTA